VWHDSFIWVTWLIHMCAMTHSYVWHDSLVPVWHYSITRNRQSKRRGFHHHICVTLLNYSVMQCDAEPVLCICVYIYTYMCSMTQPKQRGFHSHHKCASWLIHMCDTTHSYMWHDSFIWVTWLTYQCHTVWCRAQSIHMHIHIYIYTYVCVFHDSITRNRQSKRRSFHLIIIISVQDDAFICVTWLIHMCDKTHSYMWHDSFTWVTRLDYQK